MNELKAKRFKTLQEEEVSPFTRSWLLGSEGLKLKVSYQVMSQYRDLCQAELAP